MTTKQGIFYHFVTKDLKHLGMHMIETEKEQQSMEIFFISKKLRQDVLSKLFEENTKLEQTKDI